MILMLMVYVFSFFFRMFCLYNLYYVDLKVNK